MKKLYYILVVCFSSYTIGTCAQERSLEEVQEVACAFFAQMESDTIFGAPPRFSTSQIAPLTRDSTPYLYIVNDNHSGWCIVSNDTRYTSVIGYGRDGACPTDTALMPNGMKWLLEHHMNMIDSMRANPDTTCGMMAPNNIHVMDSTPYTIGTKLLCRNGMENYWDQSGNASEFPDIQKIYNKFCPDFVDNEYGRAIAGCSAVAVAQLLWYWGFPDQAVIPDTIYRTSYTPIFRRSTHYYDWRNMPNMLDNATDMYKVDQVAGLLRDCGYAEHMLYTSRGSAARTHRMYEALTHTFHYHAQIIDNDSNIVYSEMIKAEIDALRPVICQAWKFVWDSIGAHSFVIDGYDTNGMFHVNWGWGKYTQQNRGTWWDMGFYGYHSWRSFVTEIYPNCDTIPQNIVLCPVTYINDGKCVTLYARDSVMPNIGLPMVVKSGGHLNIEAGEKVILHPGFRAEYGSKVYIGIRNFCEQWEPPLGYFAKAKKKDVAPIVDLTERIQDGIKIVPNPVSDILHVHSDEDIEQLTIYNISGQFITRTNQLEINVSGLPQGIYLLRAVTTDGQVRQAKFIKE